MNVVELVPLIWSGVKIIAKCVYYTLEFEYFISILIPLPIAIHFKDKSALKLVML